MTDVTILPVKPGSLNAQDKSALRKAGVIVIEHDNPAELRLIRPYGEIDGSALLNCAMQALASTCGQTASVQREHFTRLLASMYNAQLGLTIK